MASAKRKCCLLPAALVVFTASAGFPDDIDPELDALLALQGDKDYGEYLASECTTCHQADGSNEGIPSITGWIAEDFKFIMHAYKRKQIENPVMQMMAGKLANEEIAALAAYFETLE